MTNRSGYAGWLKAGAGLFLGMACLLTAAGTAWGQVGDLHRFGKNKIHYQTFDWHVYKAPHFDVYYYPESEEFLGQVVSYAESAYLYLTKALDHEPRFRIPLVFYRTHAEFQQTNITLSSIPEGALAFAESLEHRLVLSIDHPPDFLYDLIVHEMTHIFEYSILYQDSLGRAIRGRAPGWILEGLASFMAKDEDSMDQMFIRDAVIHGLLPPITKVQGSAFLVYRYGHAAFDFIEANWGMEGVRSFLSEYRRHLLTASLEKPIKEAFGIEADEFDRRFKKYLRKKYLPTLIENGEPQDYGKEIGFKLPGVATFSPVLSPSGDLVAVITNRFNHELDVVVLNAKDGKVIKNLTKGFSNEYEYLSTRVHAGESDLTWSPDGDRVAVFARRENSRVLLIANALKGGHERVIPVPAANAASPAYSPDGKSIIFSGNIDGIVDILELNLETEEVRNLTNDEYFDSNPSWSSDGKTILYNRRVDAYEKVFLLDYNDPSRKTQLTFGPSSEITPAFSRDGKKIYYSSDGNESGIFNLYSVNLETGAIEQYSDVMGGFFHPQDRPGDDGKDTVVATTYFNGSFRLFEVNVSEPIEVVKPEERVDDIAEMEPFEPPLRLTVDDEEKSLHEKRTYHVESVPEFGIGIASDSTVFGNSYLQFSDLLGDRRFWVSVTSVANFQNFGAGYANLSHRLQYNYTVFDYRDFILLPLSSQAYTRVRANRYTGGTAGVSYPINRYYRLESTLGLMSREILNSQLQPLDDPTTADPADFAFIDFTTLRSTSPFVSGAIIGDTVRYAPWGPWHGKRFSLTVSTSPVSSGAQEADYTNYDIDYRAYGRATLRSLFAFRLSVHLSRGAGTTLIGTGGYRDIRGYRFREFIGDQTAVANIEFRYPLVDELRFPFGSIRQIRGLLFFDVGTAWTQDGKFFDRELGGLFRDFSFYDKDNNALQDGRASYGLGFNFRMGILELHWTFAKRLPFMESEPSTCAPAVAASCVAFDIFGNCVRFDTAQLATALNSCEKVKIPTSSSWRSDFYIGYAF